MAEKPEMPEMLSGKTIVIGVCGGIAAYKAADITSRLKKLGANVRVCMTKSAQQFISPLTLQSLSQNFVATDMFESQSNWDIEHISFANSADVILIVPATANVIGKVANGIADDFLTTTVMATQGKVIFAPAMNCNMYANPIVQRNTRALEDLGYVFIEPAFGRLACGVDGKGKLAEVDEIISTVIEYALYEKDLLGKNIVITAGPTREKIDDVRFITNHSSGKMGYALAQVAKKRGAKVTLISGRVNLPQISGIDTIYIDSAREMYDEVMERSKNADIIIKAAAVGDFYVKNSAKGKLKKDKFTTIELEKNIDILQELGRNKKFTLVGFCMETEELSQNATQKLINKNADFIVANDLTQEGAGFGVDTNIVKIFHKDGTVEALPLMTKEALADEILNRAKGIDNICK